jgi:hypothetical protein
MSAVEEPLDHPPSYDDCANHNAANILLQPTIHILAGQSIHAESASSAPLYKLNRGIATLSHATTEVEFERVEMTVRTDANDAPSVKQHTRNIYLLRHIPPSFIFSELALPAFFIEALSRKALGSMGLKRSRLRRTSWKVLPVDVSGRSSKWNVPSFVKDAEPLFEIRLKGGRYEWSDGGGNPIAVEDEGEGQHRLVVTAALRRETVDALVALWCCRLWQYSAEHQDPIYTGVDGGEFCSSASDTVPSWLTSPLVRRTLDMGKDFRAGTRIA